MNVCHSDPTAGGFACSDPENPSPRSPLTPAPRWAGILRHLTGREAPSYRKLCYLANDDRLGIEIVRVNGHLFAYEADIPAMAARLTELGLMPSSETAHRVLTDVAA